MAECYLVPDLAPGEIHRAEQTIHRSRFIVTMARVSTPEEAKAFIDSVKQEHAQATHNCWAFAAGEPGSTAQVAVVTRYFGGILLGTGGLVRAYQGSVKLGLETLPTTERVPCDRLQLTLEHPFVNIALREFETHQAQIIKKDFGLDATFTVSVPQTQTENLIESLTQKTSGALLIEKL